MSYRGNLDAGRRSAYTPHQHGATGDSRYPSPRILRNAIANVLDVVVVFGPFMAGYLFLLLNERDLMLRDDQTPILLTSIVVVLTTSLVNAVLLPSFAGSSIGQLVTGLVWIRGSDGSRPSVREMLRAFFNHRGPLRLGGVQQHAPALVVVRRRDLAAPAMVTGSLGYTEH
ncbi:RDD family protein [Nocardia sp. AG03]|uniref:RDD family protein n=1 Tax=Nocardia sp. AG03 TaxID=3025312 RepID=UPI00241872EA|nr:RDD family protein [Nocardia sp. AG03]